MARGKGVDPQLERVTTITDVARAAGVSPATVSRALNGTGTVSPARAQRVQGRRRAPRLSPVRPGARAAPAAQPGVGRDHRRHREPVLHVGGPRHRRRRPRRGPPARAVQLRRGSRDRGGVHRRRRRRTDGRRGHLGRLGARSRRWQPLLARGIPVVAVDRRPARRARRLRRRRQPPAAGRPRRRTSPSRVRRASRASPARTGSTPRTNALRRLSATRSPRAGLRPDRALVRRADFKEDGGYRADPLAAREPAPRSMRCSSPTTR